MFSALERLLHLRSGDLRRGFPLVAYLFLTLSSYMMARVARDALFLDHFDATSLPYVDMTIAVIVGLVMAFYLRISHRFTLFALTQGSLVLFAVLMTGFWWMAHYRQHPYLYPVFYVWVGIFGVLASTQVWTLASYLFTTREARRLIGVLGGGAISGGILGGFFSTAISRRYGAEALLLIIALFMLICVGMVHLLRKKRRLEMEEEVEEGETREDDPGGEGSMWKSLSIIWNSPYLFSIAGLICLASMVTAVVGWQFKAIAKASIPEKDALASFFGMFYGYTGVLALLTQLLLTSRLLKRTGLGVALLILPITLMIGSLGVLIWGTLGAVVILRGSDSIFRYSVDRSTVEMLYFPVPTSLKTRIKPLIDTVVWRLGDGLGGSVVLVFVTMLGLSVQQLSWINILLLGVWLFVVILARKYYVETLSDNIQRHCLDAERVSMAVFERYTVDVLKARLRSEDTKDVIYALELIPAEPDTVLYPAVRELLNHPDGEARAKALGLLNAAGDITVRPQVERLLGDPDISVRTEALLYLARYARIDPLERIQSPGDFPNFSVQSAMVAYLAWPGPMRNTPAARTIMDTMISQDDSDKVRTRIEAARLLALLPDHYGDQLARLLEDSEPDVLKEALKTVGALRSKRFLPELLRSLQDERLSMTAIEVLSRFGDDALPSLKDCLRDTGISVEARREIPRALSLIGSPSAVKALSECLLDGDAELRKQAIVSLNTLYQTHPDWTLDGQIIDIALYAEITGQHRTYQILDVLRSCVDETEPVITALRKDMDQRMERIFRLMALRSPSHDFMSVYAGFRSGNLTVHDNALEFLDNVLKPSLRVILAPLLDRELEEAERARVADRLTGMPVEGAEHALRILLEDEDVRMKIGVVEAIGKLRLESLYPRVRVCLDHYDPRIRKAARSTLEER